MREAWWALAPRVPEGKVLVIVARRPLGDAKTRDIVEELEGVLEEAGVLKG
jgi:hypothetical protein